MAKPPPRRGDGRQTAKDGLIGIIQRRGLSPIAVLAEFAWNLREWLREAAADRSLNCVLESFLPGIRQKLELSVIDAELSHSIPELPAGDRLTAANLVAFIEALRFPGGARILPPAAKPPSEWRTLARSRAIRIAMQLIDKDGKPLFDRNKESDLKEIEQMDRRTLAWIWKSLEDFDPINASGNRESVAAAPQSHEAQSCPPTAPRSTKPRGRPKADYQACQREAKLAADWKQAKTAGLTKREFAKDKGLTFNDFDALLDRVAARKRASE